LNSKTKKFIKKDASVFMRASETGIVDQVLLSINDEGFKFVKIKVRTV
ncbi:unnamed protein product, partial [Rotaria sp. Silwood1]